MVGRAPPEQLEHTWDQALHGSDAIGALGASRALFKEISKWQSQLVAEAITTGASWEEVGDALGTTRQAAWARFKSVSERLEGRKPMAEEVAAVRRQVNEEVQSLKAELRRMDSHWREERGRIQQSLRDLERRRTEERKALQGRIRDLGAALRNDISRLQDSVS
jgi:chromosome segregation ATPase